MWIFSGFFAPPKAVNWICVFHCNKNALIYLILNSAEFVSLFIFGFVLWLKGRWKVGMEIGGLLQLVASIQGVMMFPSLRWWCKDKLWLNKHEGEICLTWRLPPRLNDFLRHQPSSVLSSTCGCTPSRETMCCVAMCWHSTSNLTNWCNGNLNLTQEADAQEFINEAAWSQ